MIKRLSIPVASIAAFGLTAIYVPLNSYASVTSMPSTQHYAVNSSCIDTKFIPTGWTGEIDLTVNQGCKPIVFNKNFSLSFKYAGNPITSVWNGSAGTGGVSWHHWNINKNANNYYTLTTQAVSGNNDLQPGKTYSFAFSTQPNYNVTHITVGGYIPSKPATLTLNLSSQSLIKQTIASLSSKEINKHITVNAGSPAVIKNLPADSYSISLPVKTQNNLFYIPTYSSNPITLTAGKKSSEQLNYKTSATGNVSYQLKNLKSASLKFDLQSTTESFNKTVTADNSTDTLLPTGTYDISATDPNETVTPNTIKLSPGSQQTIVVQKIPTPPSNGNSVQGWDYSWGLCDANNPTAEAFCSFDEIPQGISPVLAFGLAKGTGSNTKLVVQWNTDKTVLKNIIASMNRYTSNPKHHLWLSMGGANGPYMRNSGISSKDAAAQIAKFVNSYHVYGVDWDYEGQVSKPAEQWILDTARALRNLEPKLYQTLTIPDPITAYNFNLPIQGKDIIDEVFTKNNSHPVFNWINKMAFDYGALVGSNHCQIGPVNPNDPESSCYIKSIATAAQYLQQRTGQSLQWAKNHVGEVLMIGKDDGGEIVTPATAKQIADWMRHNGYHHIGFWALSRDQNKGGSLAISTGIDSQKGEFSKIITKAMGTAADTK